MNSKSSSASFTGNSSGLKPDARIRRLVEKVLPEIIEVRHALHRRPELAGEEVGTASLIREKLRGVRGLDVRKPYLKTDVVALLAGKNPGANVTLRADIDYATAIGFTTYGTIGVKVWISKGEVLDLQGISK